MEVVRKLRIRMRRLSNACAESERGIVGCEGSEMESMKTECEGERGVCECGIDDAERWY